ncbi:MAG: hypothetical protein KatS3mg025_1818 [Bacteroidia bacterium]|nr:MAG: hypothetical protein KatS3mg025_1818 [Bacteroidia bacterium]
MWAIGVVILGIVAAAATLWAFYERKKHLRLEHSLRITLGTPQWQSALHALLHRLKQQEAATHAQQAFLSALSHELKTPLTILLGYLDTLVQGAYKDPEVLRPFLAKALAQVHRMNALVQDTLLLAQIESGGWSLQPEPTPLYPLLEEVWGELEPLWGAKRISLRWPPHHLQDLTVEADPFALRKVFKNLLENAILYSPEGTIITVSWTYQSKDHRVTLSIHDEGMGIPPEHLPHIFDRFYRVDKSRSRQSGGTGLGLSIVKELLEAHGERITVESTVGRGTTFSFSLPACA